MQHRDPTVLPGVIIERLKDVSHESGALRDVGMIPDLE
jgi:hypothetical protein